RNANHRFPERRNGPGVVGPTAPVIGSAVLRTSSRGSVDDRVYLTTESKQRGGDMKPWLRKLTATVLAVAALGIASGASAQQKIRVQTAVPTASIYFELMKRYA